MGDDRRQIVEYWEQSHRDQDPSRLTGTSLEGHQKFLRVSLPSGGNTLCIGVGDGCWVESIVRSSGRGAVWVLDVVRSCIPETVSVIDPASLPSGFFDLALSLWVAPHMDNSSLAGQLRHVVRSLSDDGVLALHYNETLDDSQLPSPPPVCIGMMIAGTVLRSRREILAMVGDAGGVLEIANALPHPELNMCMIAAHVRRTPG